MVFEAGFGVETSDLSHWDTPLIQYPKKDGFYSPVYSPEI